jgi:hypothetical protein
MNHATKPAIKAAPMIPPTTPPAIAPAFDLLLDDDDGDDKGIDTPEDDPGVIVPCFLVELGMLETLPVTSGESVIQPISTAHERCGSLAKTRTPDTLRQCYIPGTGLWVQ